MKSTILNIAPFARLETQRKKPVSPALRLEHRTKPKGVSLSDHVDQSHVIPRIAGFIRPRLRLLIEQTFSSAPETNHTSYLTCYKTHKISNQCLRGNEADHRDDVLDREVRAEVDAPIHANDPEAEATNTDEVIVIVVVTETANDDQEVP